MSRGKTEQAVDAVAEVAPQTVPSTPPPMGLIGRTAHLKRMTGISGAWDGCTYELGPIVYVGAVRNENGNEFAGVVVEMPDGTLVAHPFEHVALRKGKQVSDA